MNEKRYLGIKKEFYYFKNFNKKFNYFYTECRTWYFYQQFHNQVNHGILQLFANHFKDLNNYRLITLDNCDFKMFTFILNIRIKSIIHNIISLPQIGFLQGKSIFDNIITLDLIFKNYKIKKFFQCAVILLDFQKSYAMIEWL